MDLDQQLTLSCTNCKSSHVSVGRVRSAFWHDDRLVVVQNIPAAVCEVCGEQFYDDATAIGLDLLRGEGFPEESACAELRVPVFMFEEWAAPKETV